MRRWKRYAAGAMAAAAAVCAGVSPAAAAGLQNPAEEVREAAETQSPEPGSEDPASGEAAGGVFQMLPAAQPVQTYDSGDYQIQVFGGFTRMTDAGGISSALEDSRLLYKRGTMLLVSSEFDFYNGRPDQVVVDSVSGSSGTTQYLSVLEQDRSIEDYYTDIQWPDELPNSNIVEISSTLDTSDTVLMVRYSDRTVAAFNYVTGKLLFRDESEKTELEFGEYVEGWLTDTWDGLTGGMNGNYVQVEEAWNQAGNENAVGFLPPGGQAVQDGMNTGGETFLTEDGGNLEAGTGSLSGTEFVPDNGTASGSDKETVLVIADGRLTETDGLRAEAGEEAAPEDGPRPAGTPESTDVQGGTEEAENGEPSQPSKETPGTGKDGAAGLPAEESSGSLESAGALIEEADGEGQAADPGLGLDGTALTAAADGNGTAEEPGETAAGTPAEEPGIWNPAGELVGGELSEELAAGDSAGETMAGAESGESAGTAETAAAEGVSAEMAGEDAGVSAEMAGEDAGMSAEMAGGDIDASDAGILAASDGDMSAGSAGGGTASAQAAPTALLTVYDPVTRTYQVYRTAEYLSAGGQERRSQEGQGGVVTQTNVETVTVSAAGSLQDQMGGLAVALAAVLGSACLMAVLYVGNRKKDR